MVDLVDGFNVKSTYRGSWKAEIKANGALVAIVPVAWTIGRRQRGAQVFLEVRFKDLKEMENMRLNAQPFIVALALAHDYDRVPRKIRSFQAIFEVASIGKQSSADGIDTEVLTG